MKHHLNLAAAILALSGVPQAAPLQIGAWVGSPADTSLDSNYPQPTRENIQAFVALQGRKIEYVEYYAIWPEAWSKVKRYADIAALEGTTLFVTWQPNGYSAPDILAGKGDAYIGKFAKDMKSYPHEIWLRPLHEANGGDWYTWAVGNSSLKNTDENVAEAFRHIVKIFRDSGVTNVKWVWTTNAENMTTGNPTSYDGTYPGDDWADYISIDGYNFGTFHTVANSGWASKWKTFKEVFGPSYRVVSTINKPLFIAEFSSSEMGGDKAKWYRDAFASLATSFPKVFALMIFSMNDANGDWRINTTDASLQAWKECVATYAPVSTGLRPGAATPSSSQVRALGAGRVRLDLATAGPVRLEVRDLQGNLLERRHLGGLGAGTHDLDLGASSAVRVVAATIGSHTNTLAIGPL